MADPLRKADAEAVARTKQLFVFNQVSVSLAMAAGMYFYFAWIDAGIFLIGEAYLGIMLLVIEWARRTVTVEKLAAVGIGILLMNWLTAVILTTMVPFSFPLGILQVVAPVIAAGPVLERRGLVRVVIGAVFLGAIVAAIGLGNSDSEINDAIPETTATVLVVVGVAVMMLPIGIATWDAHERQQLALRRALVTNELIRDSRSRLVRAADNERRRLERDLHDGAQQQLVAVTMQLRLLGSQDGLGDAVDPLVEDLESALANLRELAHGIYPPLLMSRGLGEALIAAARRTTLQIDVEALGVGRYSPDVEAAVYFCCLEAIQNATKHAGPGARVTIRLAQSDGHLDGHVHDDGQGFQPGDSPGRGLSNMADRIGAIGGELTVADDNGTHVDFRIPTGPVPPV